MNEQVWWYLARASGLVSWALVTAAVSWGLALSGRLLGTTPRPAWLLDLHRFLGALALTFTGVHLAALAADSYVQFSPADLLIPLAATWRPAALAWGIVALYLLAAVEITSLLQRRLPRAAWRRLHMTSPVLFALATTHAFAAGHEAGNPLLQWAALIAGGLVVFLLAYRMLTRRRAATVRVLSDHRPARRQPAQTS